ncbi:ATP-grasp domain-containing protein [Sphingosinicella rhizophila]|uniref:ATP-grasp domain-containing protein n=1 Tax=Sphingosinicella rhizophila TaxID=3050082 RepID=A0ABU3QAC4_9SPHN|nr:hypothetical protein [Sphingosinicella sp. GR2756]MDT9600338.1 hypothetical protein [Sphingosinicella sp. GR2756]
MIVAENEGAASPASRKIAYLCCEGTASWSTDRRHDAFEHDESLEIFAPAFRARGIVLEEVVWDAPGTDWRRFDGALIGTAWDYARSPDAFLAKLELISSQVPLSNDLDAVRWNVDKSYLRDLERRGAPSIPTFWYDDLRQADLDDVLRGLGAAKLVIKPVIGAGGCDQFVSEDGKRPPDDHPLWRQKVMIQPLLEAIRSEGEYSFIYFDRIFSHALRKTPAPSEYRVQSVYDGKMHGLTPSAADQTASQAIMKALPHRPLYARIDMVRRDDGQLALMECELIEPYLFPEFDDSKGERMALAAKAWLDRSARESHS